LNVIFLYTFLFKVMKLPPMPLLSYSSTANPLSDRY
jgi:hypothetical protein